MSTFEMVLWGSFAVSVLALLIGRCCCMIKPPQCPESDEAIKAADVAENDAHFARG